MTTESEITWKFKMAPEPVFLKRNVYQVPQNPLKDSLNKSGSKSKKLFTSKNAPFSYSTTTVLSSNMLKDWPQSST